MLSCQFFFLFIISDKGQLSKKKYLFLLFKHLCVELNIDKHVLQFSLSRQFYRFLYFNLFGTMTMFFLLFSPMTRQHASQSCDCSVNGQRKNGTNIKLETLSVPEWINKHINLKNRFGYEVTRNICFNLSKNLCQNECTNLILRPNQARTISIFRANPYPEVTDSILRASCLGR